MDDIKKLRKSPTLAKSFIDDLFQELKVKDKFKRIKVLEKFLSLANSGSDFIQMILENEKFLSIYSLR